MATFQYHSAILTRFPNIVGGVIEVKGVRGGKSSAALQAAYTAEQQAVIARIGATPLSEIESLAAWRAAFRAFNVDPTQYRSAAEALLRRLTKKGDIPVINALVDMGNLVSIRYGLPVAVFNTAQIAGAVTVQFADGSESFTDLGASETVNPEAGEVVFADTKKMVIARRWCWRQSDESAAREDTTDILITVEALHDGGRAAVASAVKDLESLISEHVGGTARSALLDPTTPQFT